MDFTRYHVEQTSRLTWILRCLKDQKVFLQVGNVSYEYTNSSVPLPSLPPPLYFYQTKSQSKIPLLLVFFTPVAWGRLAQHVFKKKCKMGIETLIVNSLWMDLGATMYAVVFNLIYSNREYRRNFSQPTCLLRYNVHMVKFTLFSVQFSKFWLMCKSC